MGLDMYAYVTTKDNYDPVNNQMIFPEKGVEFYYWRKHHELHEWMAKHWCSQTGKPDLEFNCVNLPLNKEMLQTLQKDIKSCELYSFLNSRDLKVWVERADYDEAFTEQALKFLEEDLVVLYSSWW